MGIVNTLVGVNFIGKGIINQAQSRVGADLNSAGEIYKQFEQQVANVARFTTTRRLLYDALLDKDRTLLAAEMNRVFESADVDFLTVTDQRGIVLMRAANPELSHDDLSDNRLVAHVLEKRNLVVSTQILAGEKFERENYTLADRARIQIIPTARVKYQREGIETSAMVIASAAPFLREKGELIGVLYCGKMINNNFEIVDKVKNTVFLDEKYKGKNLGTATIFMRDLRVSTNVMNEKGIRAMGTLISKEVYEAVLEKGVVWMARAFVVNDWYLTAYRPIENIDGQIIGVLYVGILERKYTDWRNQIVFIYLLITLVSMVIVYILAYVITTNITRPLSDLASTAKKFGQGVYPESVEIKSHDEIAELGKTFQSMVFSIKKRDEELKEYAQRTVVEAERLAIIGQLAAGVAHEINNPLTGIILYCDLVLRSMSGDNPQRKNLGKINNEALRCKKIVKGLLDFARQKKPERLETSIKNTIDSVLALIERQSIFMNIEIKKEYDPALPLINIDPAHIQQVLINIIMNAAESMDGHGVIRIKSFSAEGENNQRNVIVEISDSGPGIKQDYLKKIFEPFFTTKSASHGVGLGLSVCVRIMEDHGGKIQVFSREGEGTTFSLLFPCEPASQ